MGALESVVVIVAIVVGPVVAVWAATRYVSSKRRLAENADDELNALRRDVDALGEELSAMREAVADVTLMLDESSADAALPRDDPKRTPAF